MGEYEVQEERVNEYPLYKKAEEDHYIYRTKGGKWFVAPKRAGVDGNAGSIMTQGTALLPTSEGVAWNFRSNGMMWVPDGSISVIDAEVSTCHALFYYGHYKGLHKRQKQTPMTLTN